MRAPILPHLLENIPGFRGRGWLPGLVLDWWDHRKERILLLTGGPGTGKSMVSAWFAGYGTSPRDPVRRAELQRLRGMVQAAHFCFSQDSWNNSPKGLADNLARQFTTNLDGFDKALLAQVGKNVSYHINQKIQTNYKNVTGIAINTLDLGELLDEPGFTVALLSPLVELYKSMTSKKPLLVVVDALDEAVDYEGKYKITNAILALAAMQAPVRIIATVRDPDILPEGFASAHRVNLISDAPPGEDDVADFIRWRLKKSRNATLVNLIPDVIQRAGNNFLFASLVVQDLVDDAAAGRQPTVEDIPDRLPTQYRRNIERLTGDNLETWKRELRPVLGLLAVAQDPHLRLKALAQVRRWKAQATYESLDKCRSYLAGRFDLKNVAESGPFTLFHKSFADFLVDPASSLKYYIDPAEPHGELACHYWPLAAPQPDYLNWDEYGLRNVPIHLSGAADTIDDEERHLHTLRLVDLVVDPAYQRQLTSRDHDLSQVDRNLQKALQTACMDQDPAGLAAVIRVAHQLNKFRERSHRARTVFRLAARGELEAARMSLARFPAGASWRAAAELLIAWLAAEANPTARDAARALIQSVASGLSGDSPLHLLARRAGAAVGDPAPGLGNLVDVPPGEILEAIVFRLRSEKIQAGLVDSYIDSAENSLRESAFIAESEAPTHGPDSAPVDNARVNGPVLVAHAAAHMATVSGYRPFLNYLHIMAANRYVQYRNLALEKLLEAVLNHPDPAWTRSALAHIIAAALNPGGAHFTETFGLTLLGLKSAVNYQSARDALEQRRSQEMARISMLSEERGRNDITGFHKRRLAALALAYSLLPGEALQARSLLNTAALIPRGYAGFLAPAWLNLAETALIMGVEMSWIRHALNDALDTASYIQDPVFRARTYLFINTLMERWWNLTATGGHRPTDTALEATIFAFTTRASDPDFAPHYHCGQQITAPATSPDAHQLPDDLVFARRPSDIANALGYTTQDLLAANREQNWKGGDDLDIGTLVALPDPDFAPWLAAYLAARVVSSGLPPRQKQKLIQPLIPVALPDRTALDTTVARLLYAARTTDLEVLRACELDSGNPQGG